MVEQPVREAAGDGRRAQVVAGVADPVFQHQGRADVVHDVPEIGVAGCGSSAKDGSRSARWMRLATSVRPTRTPADVLMKQRQSGRRTERGIWPGRRRFGNRVAQEIGEGLAEVAQVRTGAAALRPAGQGRAGGTQGRPDVVGSGQIARAEVGGGKLNAALASAGGSFRSEFSIMDHASLFDPSGERGWPRHLLLSIGQNLIELNFT